MPDRVRFRDTESSTPTKGYYSTLFHELTHWTGPESRCDRDPTGWFGDASYAIEGLVAELGAAFLCAELAISPHPRPDHEGYIAHWMEVMKADKRAIFTAAARANEAAGFSAGPVISDAAHGRPLGHAGGLQKAWSVCVSVG